MFKETIGPRIKAFRKGRGITQAELAKSLGYSHKSVITHIEKGESEMSYEKMLRLLRTYAADANELFDVERIDELLKEHEISKKKEAKRTAWMKDILFDVDGELFSYRVGGALIKGDEILLMKENDRYSLPSGVVQIGETSEEAIIRTFQDTTGFNVKAVNVLSTHESLGERDGRRCHQLGIFYRLESLDAKKRSTPGNDGKKSDYVWVSLAELKTINLHPAGIADKILSNAVDEAHFVNKE